MGTRLLKLNINHTAHKPTHLLARWFVHLKQPVDPSLMIFTRAHHLSTQNIFQSVKISRYDGIKTISPFVNIYILQFVTKKFVYVQECVLHITKLILCIYLTLTKTSIKVPTLSSACKNTTAYLKL